MDRGDYATAHREWLPLAEEGDPLAQANLGVMYEKGAGVPQNYAEAVRWIARQPSRGMLRRSPTSAICIGKAGASRRTMPKR